MRASMPIARRISCTGRVRLRAMSVASAFSGLTYSVCRPGRGLAARSTRLGRKPAKVFPPPVGAISRTLSPVRPACSIAIWCGRGDHPWAANHVANGSGSSSAIVPAMAGAKHVRRMFGKGRQLSRPSTSRPSTSRPSALASRWCLGMPGAQASDIPVAGPVAARCPCGVVTAAGPYRCWRAWRKVTRVRSLA